MPQCNTNQLFDTLRAKGYTIRQILPIARFYSYFGNLDCGNALQKLCFSKMDTITADDYHEYSVQNTKYGYYGEAFTALEKAMMINAADIEGYYGWVLLYYNRDYERALQHLQHYDALNPNTVEAPVGENIHFLKGLCYYQTRQYAKAIEEFLLNETFEKEHFGKKNCNTYIYFYIGRCYDKLNNAAKAEYFYLKSIRQSQFATEAQYYLGALYLQTQQKKKAADHLNKALALIKKGYKQQDIYVELFDEVYQTQIEEALSGNKFE